VHELKKQKSFRKYTKDFNQTIPISRLKETDSLRSSDLSNINVASPIRKSVVYQDRPEGFSFLAKPLIREKDPLLMQLEELKKQLL
jgi:hypothetical protein